MAAPMRLICASLIGLSLMAGCSVTRNAVEDPRQVWCDNNQPRRHTPAVIDAMSRAELDEMNGFNAKGVEWCSWKP